MVVHLDPAADLVFDPAPLPFQPNALRVVARDEAGAPLADRTFYSVGGGFVVEEGLRATRRAGRPPPLPFRTGAELLAVCAAREASISDVALANEAALRPEADVRAGLLRIWRTMEACARRSRASSGTRWRR